MVNLYGIFHRPRAEAELISEQVTQNLPIPIREYFKRRHGALMQQLVTQEGWLRSTVEIAPVPFIDILNQRPFEKHSILCFRHPSRHRLEVHSLSNPRIGWQSIRFTTSQASCRISTQAEILESVLQHQNQKRSKFQLLKISPNKWLKKWMQPVN